MKLLLAIALLAPLLAHADKERPPPKCTAGEKWTGSDKAMHFGAGATIAFATTLGTEKPLWGFGAGVAVGALKELSDRGGNGCSSGKDFGVTVLGAAVGAFAGDRVLVYRNKGTTVVAYRQEF